MEQKIQIANELGIWIDKLCPVRILDLDHDLDSFNPDIS